VSIICIVDEHGALAGSVGLAELVRAGGQAHLTDLFEAGAPSVAAEADLPEVARLMTDYNLIAMPVVDGDGLPVGIIAVDDVLELLLPDSWRRRAGIARD
jgi:Mg/Co/Ni transporter MgtE